jgi:hypothetical protein
MFNNLDDQIENIQGRSPTQAERVVRYLVVAALSVLLFGGLLSGNLVPGVLTNWTDVPTLTV